jgi:hypothetical protein
MNVINDVCIDRAARALDSSVSPVLGPQMFGPRGFRLQAEARRADIPAESIKRITRRSRNTLPVVRPRTAAVRMTLLLALLRG